MPKPTRVCLIDDDTIYLFVMRKIIRNLNLCEQIEEFSDPKKALASFKSRQTGLPDLIMFDLNMPVMDGWEFLDKYRTLLINWATKPALYMVSSSVDQVDISRANQQPMLDGYLVKPITAEKLHDVFDKFGQ